MEPVNPTTTGIEVKEGDGKTQKVSLFINRNYTLLFCGHAISISGDVVFTETLSLWVALTIARGQSWAPLALGGVLLAAIIPTLLLGSIAGVFVDRWVKRRTMLRMDAARTVLIALLLPLTGIVALPVSVKLIMIYAVVFLNSACSQFFNPSSFALIGDIGPQIAVLFNALSFACSFAAISFVRIPAATDNTAQEAEKDFFREYLTGLRFIVQNRVLLVALIGACLAVIPEGAQNSLGIFFYQKNLHAPLVLFGLVGTAIGIGTIVGALSA